MQKQHSIHYEEKFTDTSPRCTPGQYDRRVLMSILFGAGRHFVDPHSLAAVAELHRIVGERAQTRQRGHRGRARANFTCRINGVELRRLVRRGGGASSSPPR
jgi:hypothetical protein